jgi:hypothetical protein
MRKRLGALVATLIGSFVTVAVVAAFTYTAPKGNGLSTPSPSPSRTHAVSSNSTSSASASNTSATSSTPSDSSGTGTAETEQQIYASLPQAIRKKKSVSVAVYVDQSAYASSKGNKIVGLDSDLAEALSGATGVQWQLASVNPAGKEDGYSTVVQDVNAKDYDAGISSLEEDSQREQQVDFVTYLTVGGSNWGIAFPKDSGMLQPTVEALKLLISNHQYRQILADNHLPSDDAVTADQVTIVRASQ